MDLTRFLAKLAPLMLAVFLCALPAASAQAAPAALVCISPGSLQTAINAAADGASLALCSGTFNETLTISKTLTLVGASRDTTILQPAASTSRVITVASGKNLTLQNLQVTGGHPVSAAGGGILLDSPNGGNLTLVSVWIHHNSADYGGGIFQAGASVTLSATDSLFDHNTSNNHGGAIYVEGNLVLTNTTFTSNTASWHGGGAHVQSGSATLTGGTFSENHATNGNGGGLNMNNALNINGTTFTANTAGDSGGALVQWNSGKTVVIQNATFTSNTAKINGGGAYVGSYFTLTGSTFTTNYVDSGNATISRGGGIYANDGINGSQLTFIQNQSVCLPYTVPENPYCPYSTGGGLAIHSIASGGVSTITQSLFDGNKSWNGGGISAETGVNLTVYTSRFINNGQNCYHSTYHALLCGYGSGIDANHLEGSFLTLENNFASNEGGAINAANLYLVNSKLINNQAAASGGGGGAIRTQSFTGFNLLFSQNSGVQGAAIKFDSGSSTLKHITIANPTRQTGSGIYVMAGAALTLQNSIISSYSTGVNSAGTLTEDYNIYYDNALHISSSGTLISGGHMFFPSDAGFFNRSAGNYHLRWGSFAIGKGTNLGVTLDLDGQPRAGRIDIGAYQAGARFLPTILK